MQLSASKDTGWVYTEQHPGTLNGNPGWEQGGGSMSQKAFSLIAGVFFLLIALGHLLRILFGASFVVYDIPIPMWASGIAVVIAGYLAYQGLRLVRKATQ